MDPTPNAIARAGRLPPAALLLVLLAAIVAYSRVLDAPFQFDDATSVLRDPAIRDLPSAARAALDLRSLEPNRTLTALSFALDYSLGGLAPRAFHVSSLLLHLVATLLIFLLGRRLARLAELPSSEWVGVLVAGLFALHPIQSSAVSYVTQRAEILASLLYCAALLAALAAERRWGSAAGRGAWLAAAVLLVLALRAKPIAVTMPVAFLLTGLSTSTALPGIERARWRRRLLIAAPLLLLAAAHAFGTLRSLASPAQGADAGFEVKGLTPAAYGLTQLRVVATYLRLLVAPYGQNVDWDVAPSRSLLEPATGLSSLLLLALVVCAVALWIRNRARSDAGGAAARLAAFGVAWFFLVLSPTSTIVPLADPLVEHRLYLAALGPFLAISAGASVALGRLPLERRTAVAGMLGALLLLGLSAATHGRNAAWESPLSLWSDAAKKSPGKARPLAQLAFVQQEAGRLDEALPLYDAALKLTARDDTVQRPHLVRNYSAALAASGQEDEAIALLRAELALNPGNTEFATNLALAYLSKGWLQEAESQLEGVLSRDPALPEANGLLGSVALRQGKLPEAERAFRTASALQPDAAAHAYNLGISLDRLARTEEACATWIRALGLQADPVLHAKIGAMLARRCPMPR